MPRDPRPARIFQTATNLLLNKRIPHRPPWYKALQNHPPSEPVLRPAVLFADPHSPALPPKSNKKVGNGKVVPNKKIFGPVRIAYEEDGLRETFFGDHPWELARPRVVLEKTGDDSKGWDWSGGIKQAGKQMDGESVVQRQLWLIEDMKKSWIKENSEKLEDNIQQHLQILQERGRDKEDQQLYARNARREGQSELDEQLQSLIPTMRQLAYDAARKEFYRVRQEQDVERQVAREEALHDGAYFAPGEIERSFDRETEQFDGFRRWAVARVQADAQKQASAYKGSMLEMREAEAESVLDEMDVELKGDQNEAEAPKAPA